MAWSLKSIGKSLGKLVTRPGDWASSVGRQAGDVFEKVDDVALPALGFLVGGPLGAAAGGALAGGVGNGRPDLANIALGAGMGALSGPGVAGTLKSVGGGIAKNGVLGGLTQAVTGGGGWTGALKNVGGWIADNPDLVLGGLAGIEGYNQQKDANRLQDEALDFARANYADRAPLRTLGVQMLTAPRAVDPGLAIDASNPFAAPPAPGQTAAAAPAARRLPVVGRARLTS